ncbi:MAG: helix-turn-helix domain-containing protein [Pseudomonadota bacterium]
MTDDFADRLRLALKATNLSPGAFGARVGVDKSVVSRWLAGKARPGSHNLARISAELARHATGFTALAFESDEAFRAALGLSAVAPASGSAAEETLTVPFGLVTDARQETARRGEEYFGHYHAYYYAFTRPGQIARMSLMMRPAGGLIEVRYGADGFEFRGWALLLLDRLYVQLAERRFQAMLFIMTNAGQQPLAQVISGIIVGPSDQILVPTASPVVLLRDGPISADPVRDNAAFEARLSADPFAPEPHIPDFVRAALLEPCITRVPGAEDCALMRVPQTVLPAP